MHLSIGNLIGLSCPVGVQKPDVWADAKPEVGSQALSLQDWISTSSKAHALTAQGQIQVAWQAVRPSKHVQCVQHVSVQYCTF